jgi:hypothetical protein
MKRMMIGYDFRDGGHHSLESEPMPALRTPLAGLITIWRSVRSPATSTHRVPRPSQRSFALTRDLNRPSQPRLSDLSSHPGTNRFPNRQPGRTSGGDFGRLRSIQRSKLLSLRRGTRQLPPHPSTKGIPDHDQASQPRSKRHAFHIYEPMASDGTKPANDNNPLSDDLNSLIPQTR